MSKLATAASVRRAWREGIELCLLDPREEDEFAKGHPLFAASFPLGRAELDAYIRIPRLDVPIVCVDDGERGERLVGILGGLGYSDVAVLSGGLDAWVGEGYELFADVNSPSKAFGELVAEVCKTPFLAARELDERIREGRDILVVDARRFDEYRRMSIPTGRNVPGAELVHRVPQMAGPQTQVVVNCAGRTRSIIGAQSLRNAGVGGAAVAALQNGTIGWTLAGLELAKGATERFPSDARADDAIRERVRVLAERAGVGAITLPALDALVATGARTVYRFDVREADEYAAGHLAGFRHAPGGQLVQETDAYAPVRGAVIVLADTDGVRAPMTGSWLAQMGWDVRLVSVGAAEGTETGPFVGRRPAAPEVPLVSVAELAEDLGKGRVRVLDLSASSAYRARHLPGAEFVLRSELPAVVAAGARERTGRGVVLTSEDDAAARFAAGELGAFRHAARVLAGGNDAWRAAGRRFDDAAPVWTSPPIDRYRRPYEGTDVDPASMQAYLDWEYGLVAQLERDGTHRFSVLVSEGPGA